MQPSSSISTNLVTLSVHDSLTFDGVEIAINPDVFITKGNSINNSSVSAQHSRNPSFASNVTPFTSIQPPSPILPSSNMIASPITMLGTPVNVLRPNDDSSTMMRSNDASPKLNTMIQPGDIIEIKIWDKKPRHAQSSSSSPTPPDGKGNKYLSSVGGCGSSKHNESILIKAASKLQQQISTTSIFHPLSEQNKERSKSSSRPPIVPRAPSSNGSGTPGLSSLGASPKHTSNSPNITPPKPTTASASATNLSLFSRRSDVQDADGEKDEEIDAQMPAVPAVVPQLLRPKNLIDGSSPEKGWRLNLTPIASKMVEGGHVESSEGEVAANDAHSRISSLGSALSYGDDGDHAKCDDDDPFEAILNTHNLRLTFVAIVTDKSLRALKAGGRTQISILRQVADLYELSSYDMVTITKFDKDEEQSVQNSCRADYVTMTIKDQFISRGEMYQFQNAFLGKWIYAGERLSTSEGIRGTVMDIRNGKEEFKSGFITEDTKITCRSRSARIIWLVQISSEMWDYASPYEGDEGTRGASSGEAGCEIYFDKFVSFVLKLFEEWKALETSHSLTVVFFCRTFITPNKNSGQALNLQGRASEAILKDVDGRLYEDYFKVVIENENCVDWETLVTKMKKAFIRYPVEAGWKLTSDCSRLPSFAAQGNILEAINTALNMLQFHYIDRDLHRCGNSILVVSAGSGVFEVDKGLAGITKQRMMDNGIGSDLLSLGLPPLHLAPFMLFKETADPNSPNEDTGNDFDNDWRAYFEIPHWMHLSYVNYDNVQPQPSKCNTETPSNNDDVNSERPTFKTVSNGFIVHDKQSTTASNKNNYSNKQLNGLTTSQQEQKHVVLGRDFEDILEACRPRNRGSSTGCTPPALLSQLKLFGLVGEKSLTNISNIIEGDEVAENSLQAPKEWNSIDLGRLDLSPAQSSSAINDLLDLQSKSGSNSNDSSYCSTPSSVFASNLNMVLGRSPCNIHHASPSLKLIQIQQAPSLNIPSENVLYDQGGNMKKTASIVSMDIVEDEVLQKRSRSNSVASSCGSFGSTSFGNDKLYTLEAMKKAMDAFDENVQYHEPGRNELNIETTRYVQKSSNNSHSSMDTVVPIKGGIGAAINEFETKPTDTTPMPPRRNESFAVSRLKKSMTANNISSHGFSRPSSLAYTLDKSEEGLGLELSVSRHVLPSLSRSPNPSMFLPTSILGNVNQSKSYSPLEDKNAMPSSSPPTLQEVAVTNLKHSVLNRSPLRKRKPKAKHKGSHAQRAQKGSHHSRTKKWVLNPFCQKDEFEILAKRTHNSRRWSHVFPQGEIEFKRRAGPNWKSLIQPAILPVAIDVYPNQQELNDQSKYSFRHYQLYLDAMDLTYYTSHSELLMEMVRQRIVQDFQLVPQSVMARKRREVELGMDPLKQRAPSSEWRKSTHDRMGENSGRNSLSSSSNEIRHVLSMGHRFHIISCNPTSDSVDVVEYLARNATNNKNNTFKYHYNIWMPATERYQQVSQTFQRFPEEYPWNRLDNLICGDPDKTLSDRTKYRRVAFCIIPDQFSDQHGEEVFTKKMKRFIEFLEKVAQKELQIQISSVAGKTQNNLVSTGDSKKKKKGIRDPETLDFILHNRKRDKYEWIEFAVNKVWDTRMTFRIVLKWLVSSAIKVDAQIQMIQRRTSQYGLHLVTVPDFSAKSNLYLNPLMRPESICVSDRNKALMVERALVANYGFCDDDKRVVFARDVEKTFDIKVSEKRVYARQYIHRSGTLFVRLLRDINQSITFVFLENRMHIGNSSQMQAQARTIFGNVMAQLTAPEDCQSS